MNVCFICGDEGRVKELIHCVQCRFQVSVVHRYCKGLREDEIAGWTCDDCVDEKMMQLREASRKSSRLEERSIKKSNSKAKINKLTKSGITGNALNDTQDNFQRSEQQKRERIQPSIQTRQVPQMREGLVSKQKIGEKTQNLGFKDKIFRKESGVRQSKKADHDRALNKVTKVHAPNLQSASLPRNDIHVENKPRRNLIMEDSDIDDDENQIADIAASIGTRESSKIAQDRHQQDNEPRNENASFINGFTSHDEPEPQPIEQIDQPFEDPRQGDVANSTLDIVPAEPVMNVIWRGNVFIQLGKYNADLELHCYLSTKSSPEVAKAVKALPSRVGFSVRCIIDIWPMRLDMSTLTDKAIAVYFLPKDDNGYDKMLKNMMKHDLALLYEMPSKNQNLLIFPSSLLPMDCWRIQKKHYMWGILEGVRRDG